MIVDDSSDDSDVEQSLLPSNKTEQRIPSRDASPIHFSRFKPIQLSDIECVDSPTVQCSLSGAPDESLTQSIKTSATNWKDQKWESVDSFGSDNEASFQETPLQMKQLYLLVARCIAFPFNAKFQMETSHSKPRLSKNSYNNICEALDMCVKHDKDLVQYLILTGNEQKSIRNVEFTKSVQWYLDNILLRDDVKNACHKGCLSTKEIEHIFEIAIARKFRESVLLSDDSPGGRLHKKPENDPRFHAWVSTFTKLVELGYQKSLTEKEKKKVAKEMSTFHKDQLYTMFQSILGITRSEHQALFRACHLNNIEEQEDVIRRELNKRKEQLKKGECPPHWRNQSKIIRALFFQELSKNLQVLSNNLDKQRLSASELAVSNKKKKLSPAPSVDADATISKSDFVFHEKVKVTIRDANQIIGVNEGKKLFIVFELVDGNSLPLVTNSVELTSQRNMAFDKSGEFLTNSPLPQIKFTLRMEQQGLLKDDKLLAKSIHTVIPTVSENSDLIDLQRNDGTVLARLRVATFLERPSNMRKCGYLHCCGDFVFKQWKSRFLALMHLTQFHFVLCGYQPKDTQPREFIVLDSCTVEYLNEEEGVVDENVKYFFMLSSEKGIVKFGCVNSHEREQWMQWFTRATGQKDKPLEQIEKSGKCGDLEALGLTEVVNMDVVNQDHPKLFSVLFKAMLKYRLNEIDFSRGFFAPGQMFVIDEYCARYGIRLSQRHLTCLWEWLQCELKGQSIWPVMLLHSFGFCQMHVTEKRPTKDSEVVTPEEVTQWTQLSGQIELLLSEKLENFRTYFPFSCPKDDLKVTMKLFILVAEINHCSTMSQINMALYSEDRPLQLLTTVMERAALANYKQVHFKLWQYEELNMNDINDSLNIDQLYMLAHLCVDFMYELHEFYAEDFTLYPLALSAHLNAFWSFFTADLEECLHVTDIDVVSLLKVFYLLNEYFCSQPSLKLSKFHLNLLQLYEPIVDDYLNHLNVKLTNDLNLYFTRETWLPVSECCQSMQGCLEALESVKTFVSELSWPQDPFATSLKTKSQLVSAEKFQEAVKFTREQCYIHLQGFKMNLRTLLPKTVITMVNTVMFLGVQAPLFCGLPQTDQVPEEQFANAIELTSILEQSISNLLTCVIDKLLEPFTILLDQLSKYDPSIGFFASLRKIVPGPIASEQYCEYLRLNLEHLSRTLVSAAFNNFVLNWYETQLIMLNEWLKKRPDFSLHQMQQDAISNIVNGIRQQFTEQEIEEDQLNTENYGQIEDRMRKEHSSQVFY